MVQCDRVASRSDLTSRLAVRQLLPMLGEALYSLHVAPWPAALVQVPEQLELLVEKLADLSQVELKPVPWEVLWRSSGVVSLGGDAVEDTNAIYDV